MEDIIIALKKQDFIDTIYGLAIESNNDNTNKIRERIGELPLGEIIKIHQYLKEIINYCYDGTLFDMEIDSNKSNEIKKLSEKQLFLLKESLIYYIGRIYEPSIELLKKIYYADDNKYIKLNVTFSTLLSFDEEIELDFAKKLIPGNEYDKMLRSWTMAFFKNAENPYEYEDKDNDDWTYAREPRIERLKIKDSTNAKYKKAMAFRLLDLIVIYLFLENRKEDTLTPEEKEIIQNTKTDYELYSEEKKMMINDYRKKILHGHN